MKQPHSDDMAVGCDDFGGERNIRGRRSAVDDGEIPEIDLILDQTLSLSGIGLGELWCCQRSAADLLFRRIFVPVLVTFPAGLRCYRMLQCPITLF